MVNNPSAYEITDLSTFARYAEMARSVASNASQEMLLCLAWSERWSEILDYGRPLVLSDDSIWVGGAFLSTLRATLWSSILYASPLPAISDEELLAAVPIADTHEKHDWQTVAEMQCGVTARAYQLKADRDGIVRRQPRRLDVGDISRLAEIPYRALAMRALVRFAGDEWEEVVSVDVADKVVATDTIYADELSFFDSLRPQLAGDPSSLLHYAQSNRIEATTFFASPHQPKPTTDVNKKRDDARGKRRVR